tara:strand:- start:659 stop:1045 length:387 start_codon:yes stop_codon:yes gene_type:complete
MLSLERFTSAKFLRYLFVGGSSYLLVLMVTFSLHELLFFSEEKSFILALLCAFFLNLITLQFFVFKGNTNILTLGLRFVFFSVFFRLIEFLFFTFLLHINVYYLLATTISMVIGTLTKYFIYKRYLFV